MPGTADPVLARTFTPWRLGGLELPHRVITGSMHTGLETLDDGGAALGAYYAERIRGGAALVITGGLAVSPEGSGADDFSVLGDPASDARFAAAVAAVHAEGGFIAAQLFHAGRYALLDGVTDAAGRPVHPVAPSPLPWRSKGAQTPVELDDEGIRRVIGEFGAAAERAVELGFDAVEVMASEGYLINQFCSPVTNRREDGWGGDAARRRRFAVEVVRAVRSGAGWDVPVIVRMSGADLVPGSTTPAETAELARALVLAGADALNVGIGWHESAVPTVQAAVPHGVWLRYAEAVAEAVMLPEGRAGSAGGSTGTTRSIGNTGPIGNAGSIRNTGSPRTAESPAPADADADADPGSIPPTAVPVIASNRLTDLRDAEDVLAGGLITAVALARPFLADAAIVNRSREGRLESVNTCIACNQACLDRSFVKQPVSCLVNPRAGNETRYPLTLSPAPARYAVVGAGPAGLIAATDLAERGHAVTLFEASATLGGQFTLAARIPTKEDYALTVAHYASRLAALGARIELGHAPEVAELAGFDGVVLATGVRPRTVDLPGADLPHVLDYERAVLDGVPEGRVAIIGGGGIGVDLAKFLVLSHDPAVRAREFERRFELDGPSTFLESDALPQRTRVRASQAAAGAGHPVSFEPRPGHEVTILRRSGKFGAGMGLTSRWVALGELKDAGVRMISGLAYERITPEGVEVRIVGGGEADGGRLELIPADVVVVCAGQVSHDPLSAGLAAAGIRFEVVGGALDATHVDAVRATRQGLDAARALAP
ncbi:oxidoreductase [Herbiconiux solani]|uniref:oxidoreductase n=1 Tax=Herbiconiux solani TaxID=661329 RepID=UPI0008241121|nr:FAD-dependent oxidoreductase [Herbiconiux solani]